MTDVYLGLANGASVLEPIGHLAIFGQTRRAGKTTTLRTLVNSLVARSGGDVIIFRTGREEIRFPGANRLTPYFREHITWQGVETMLWTFLAGEKPRTYRPILMKAVGGAKSLDDVHRNIVAIGKKARAGWLGDRLFELDTYFKEILPWIREHPLSDRIAMYSGLNVVDLEGWPETVQQLVVAATLEGLMERGMSREPCLIVLPEARRFIPSDSKTPVTRAADRLAREGAKLNLFLWIDSQSLTGVDQLILRNFALLLQGVQTSDIEIRRVSKALEVPPRDIRALQVGDFILHTQSGVRTVHVPLVEPEEDPKVDDRERKQYEERIAQQAADIKKLEARVREEHDRAEKNAHAAAANAVTAIRHAPDLAALAEEGLSMPRGPKKRVPSEAEELALGPHDVNVTHELPSVKVTHKLPVVETDTGEMVGRIALLIAEGFWDDGELRKQADAGREMTRRGFGSNFTSGGQSVRLSEAFGKMTLWGFFRREADGYALVPGVEKRIRVKEEP